MLKIRNTRTIKRTHKYNFLKHLGILLLLSFCTSAVSAADYPSVPKHLIAAGEQAVSYRALQKPMVNQSLLIIQLDSQNQTLELKHGTHHAYKMLVPVADGNMIIDIPAPLVISETHQVVSHTFDFQGQPHQLIYTQGQETGMGEIFADGQHFYFEVDVDGVWLVNITDSALLPGLYENDVVHRHIDNAAKTTITSSNTNQSNEPTIVDILLLYTPNIVEAYPGEMSLTLLNQLIAKANQTFVDSDINMLLRLVGGEFVNYNRPSNFEALQDIEFALDGDASTTTDSSLTNLASLRNSLGADLVAMIRTHDLNEREVCGVAYFPNPNSDVLINISNVGISGGSNCLNTFTHEIGHNFGAGHQQNAGNSVGFLDFSGALIVPGQYNTIMSSIGTGDVNRDFKLPLFSNTTNTCGGEVCGDAVTADNTRTMNELTAQNAALRAQVIPGTVPVPPKSQRDADGDGVFDSVDPFPYLASETADTDDDGVGDNSDAFPNDPTESIDTDNDGVGNNADTDDDNDGTSDTQDDLPLDARDVTDNDNDGVGPSIDALDNDFQERFDADNDGIGDRQDLDDDNDGVPDFWPTPSLAQSNVVVVSAGSDELLQYSANGQFQQSLVSFPSGALSFRSDLLVTPEQQIYLIAFSDIYQFDMQREELRIAVDRSQIATNFPAHITLSGARLIVGHGLGTSYVDGFNLGTNGNSRLTSSSSTNVFRDITVFSNDSAYVVSRSTNQILTINPNASNASTQVFATSGLNRPEHMVVNAQGQLLVTNAQGRDVSRFDAQGNFLGTFINAGSGGLGIPGCITIGPDDDIYICSTNTNQILKYNGSTGAFDSVFIDANSGGMTQPVSIQFISQPADEFPYDPNHDSDADGVINPDDAFPLDPNESVDTDSDGIGNNADEDDDNDTMPDSYEIEFGFNPLDPSDAAADADGDGITNAEEFTNGTDPLVADTPAPEPPVTPIPPPASSSGGGSVGIWLYVMLAGLLVRRRSKNSSTIKS